MAHYDLRFVRPLDTELIEAVGRRFRRIITVEDGMLRGGVGEAVVAHLTQCGLHPEVIRLGIGDEWIEHGTPTELQAQCGYDEEGILRAIQD